MTTWIKLWKMSLRSSVAEPQSTIRTGFEGENKVKDRTVYGDELSNWRTSVVSFWWDIERDLTVGDGGKWEGGRIQARAI